MLMVAYGIDLTGLGRARQPARRLGGRVGSVHRCLDGLALKVCGFASGQAVGPNGLAWQASRCASC